MKLLTLFTVAFVAGFAGASGFAGTAAAKPPVYMVPGSNMAVSGYDVVTVYEGNPQRGSQDYTTIYKDAVWQFVSAENRDRFQADPQAYAPQYGGYCAWAVAEGYLAKGDPRFAKVVDGKLYLNFNRNIQSKWQEDRAGNIAKAEANWPDILED